jgi:uncharacterized membrane protein (UPF0136 family)
MNGYKAIIAGACGAVVLLALTAMGSAWHVALAGGFAAMLVASAVLRTTATRTP